MIDSIHSRLVELPIYDEINWKDKRDLNFMCLIMFWLEINKSSDIILENLKCDDIKKS